VTQAEAALAAAQRQAATASDQLAKETRYATASSATLPDIGRKPRAIVRSWIL
jgi:hypothetical protein